MYIYKGNTVTFTTNKKVKNTTESVIHDIYIYIKYLSQSLYNKPTLEKQK